MKKIIAMVGTSIFDNYNEVNNSLTHYNKDFKKMSSKDWDSQKDETDYMRGKVLEWADNNDKASAEIFSILKLTKELGEHIDVNLLASDTLTSRLAAEIIKEVLSNKGINVYFNFDLDVIPNLQVKNFKEYREEGLPNLINRIMTITQNVNPNDVVFNITGGYKGIVPYLTILGQINKSEIAYIFEETETLIKIPQLPINIDYTVFENYHSELSLLSEGVENYQKIKDVSYKNYDNLEKMGLVEQADNFACLSPIGQIFYQVHQNKYFIFYCSDDVWNEIDKQNDIKRILISKFCNKELRSNKSETKIGGGSKHIVDDDGNNNNRIYYFEENARIYIYKTFENEEKARKYINKTIDENKIKTNSKLRKMEVKGCIN